jgi:adenine C2-methylase RlmN of 23S rRNA A2503 and tRNA A37
MAEENDGEEDAKTLCKLLKKSYLFHLNLIHLNEVIGGLKPTLPGTEKRFLRVLAREHLPYTFRKSFGTEIAAACGQLAN